MPPSAASVTAQAPSVCLLTERAPGGGRCARGSEHHPTSSKSQSEICERKHDGEKRESYKVVCHSDIRTTPSSSSSHPESCRECYPSGSRSSAARLSDRLLSGINRHAANGRPIDAVSGEQVPSYTRTESATQCRPPKSSPRLDLGAPRAAFAPGRRGAPKNSCRYRRCATAAGIPRPHRQAGGWGVPGLL